MLADCWTQGSSWRGPILETKTPPARFLHYYTECLPSLHIEENPRSKLPCEGASTHLQGDYGNKQSNWWTCEAEPNKRVCPWFRGYPYLDDEGYCCRLAEHWLDLCDSVFSFCCFSEENMPLETINYMRQKWMLFYYPHPNHNFGTLFSCNFILLCLNATS